MLTERAIHTRLEQNICQIDNNHLVIFTENDEKNLNQFNKFKTPKLSEGTQNRIETHAVPLCARFESNIYMVEKKILQDEEDLTLEVPVNLNDCEFDKGKKSDKIDKYCVRSTKTMVIISALIL